MKSLKTIDHAVVLISELGATYKTDTFLDVADIAHRHNLPVAFTQKIAQRLKRAGFIEARRGSGGGYRLRIDPKKISIEIIAALFEERHLWCPLIRHQKKILV